MQNVNDLFFDGHYKDIWRTIIPEQLTIKETEFLIDYFGLNSETKVLDLMAGYGRHSLGLARKNISVVAVDNLKEYIAEITQISEAEKLPVRAVQSGALELELEDDFDLAICMGNSFNFFDRPSCIRLLHSINANLKAGGRLLINSWSIAEIAIKDFSQKSWTEINGLKVLSDSKYLFRPTRIETDSFFICPDGHTETKKAVDYIYSVAEMDTMLSECDFKLTANYSIPGRKEFALGDTRSYIVAEKL